MVKENLEWIERITPEKSDILPEIKLQFNEDGSVTIPEVTLSNPSEALKYIRLQENNIISKIRESNEYVVNEVKEMVESAFDWWYHHDKFRDWPEEWYTKSANCSDYNYDSNKEYYVDWPIKFLSEYKWNLQNFMDLLAQEIKRREFWRWNSLYVMCKRFGVSVEELKNMDTVSLIELIKNDIKNIPSLNQSTQMGDMNERLWAGNFYLSAIRDVCKKLWYK